MASLAERLPCAGGDHVPDPVFVLRGRDRWHGIDGEFEVVRCAGCGLAGTVPRLDAAELAPYYPADYYTNVDSAPAQPARPSRGNRAIAAARRRLFERFGPFSSLYAAPPGRLLDVGCGAGDLAAEFIARGWAAAGVEPGEDAARAAAARGVAVHRGTLEDAPFAASSFDALTFNHSLEHVPDPLADLRAAARLAKPGGAVIVSVPNFGGWERRLFGSRWFQLDVPRHLNHFDARSLARLATRAGLTVRRTWSTSSLLSLPGSIQYALTGRMSWSQATLYRLAYLLWPLEQPLDLLLGGDCLHMVSGVPTAPR